MIRLFLVGFLRGLFEPKKTDMTVEVVDSFRRIQMETVEVVDSLRRIRITKHDLLGR